MVERISILQTSTWSNSLNAPWMKLVVRTVVRAAGERANPPSLYVFTHLVNESVAFLYWQPTKLGLADNLQVNVFKSSWTFHLHFLNETLDGTLTHNKILVANRFALTTIKFMQNASRSAERLQCEQLASNFASAKRKYFRSTRASGVPLAR